MFQAWVLTFTAATGFICAVLCCDHLTNDSKFSRRVCSLPLAAVAVCKLISLQCRVISKSTSVLFCFKDTHLFPFALYSWLCVFSLLLYLQRADNPKRLKMCRKWRQVKKHLLKTRALMEHQNSSGLHWCALSIVV